MYRRNVSASPRLFSLASLGAQLGLVQHIRGAALAILERFGVYEAALRENRRRDRWRKWQIKTGNYYRNGLNGPRAVARRLRQQAT